MNWQDILKKEKAHCGSEKTSEYLKDEEPIIEKIPDLSGDGKITRKDVLIGRGVYDKQGNKVKKAKANPEKMILDEIEKEGGALGMKNLKGIPNLKETLDRMVKEGKIFIHKDGDIYTHKPSRGRGFTA